MFDPVAHIFIRGCGDGAHHLFQVWHPQVGVGTLPPPHRRGLAGLLFGRLSVHLSQVGALRFGQLALCQGQKATSEVICQFLQANTRASRSNSACSSPSPLDSGMLPGRAGVTQECPQAPGINPGTEPTPRPPSGSTVSRDKGSQNVWLYAKWGTSHLPAQVCFSQQNCHRVSRSQAHLWGSWIPS